MANCSAARLIGEEPAVDHRIEVAAAQVGQQRVGGDLTETPELVGVSLAADRYRERLRVGGACGHSRLMLRAPAALADGPTEEPAAAGRHHVETDVLGAGRLAEDRDALRVAAERLDVRLHPLQRGLLVEEPLVPRIRALRILAGERSVREEPEHVQAVVDGDHDDVALLREHLGVVEVTRHAGERDRIAGRALLVRAAVEPHHHRSRLGRRRVGREHVQEQAILGVARRPLERGELWTRMSEGVRLQHTAPRDGRGRRTPAQRSDRRRRERNPEELSRLSVDGSLHVAVGEVNQGSLLDLRGRLRTGCSQSKDSSGHDPDRSTR